MNTKLVYIITVASFQFYLIFSFPVFGAEALQCLIEKPDEFEPFLSVERFNAVLFEYKNSVPDSLEEQEREVLLQLINIHAFNPDCLAVFAGQFFVEKEEYEKAVTAFKNAVKLNPKNPEAKFELGKMLAKNGDSEAALVLLTQSVDLNPTNGLYQGALGNELFAQGQYSEALVHLDAAINLDPSHAGFRFWRSEVYFKLGRDLLMLQDLDQSVKLADDDKDLQALALYWRSVAHTNLRQFDEAVEDCERLIELHPNEPWVYVAKGDVFAENGDVELAASAFRMALEKNPKYAHALAKLEKLASDK